MDKFWLGVAVASFVAIFTMAGLITAVIAIQKDVIMQEAFDRNLAVQCLGKEGYYWECE